MLCSGVKIRFFKIQEEKRGLRKGKGGGGWVRGILLFGIVHWVVKSINADIAELLLILLLVQIVVSTRPLSI